MLLICDRSVGHQVNAKLDLLFEVSRECTRFVIATGPGVSWPSGSRTPENLLSSGLVRARVEAFLFVCPPLLPTIHHIIR